MDPRVLIITNEQDVTTDLVVRELRSRGIDFWRLNTERLCDYSFTCELPTDGLRPLLRYRGETIDLASVRGVWHRRPIPPTISSAYDLSPEERVLIEEQWRAVVWGLLGLRAHWMNRPDKEAAAEAKLLQLDVAGDVGMAVPQTVCTNDRLVALDFLARQQGECVVKALYAPFIEDPVHPRFVYTQLATADTFEGCADVEAAPLLIQQRISPMSDVRVVVVGDAAFAAKPCRRIEGVDWRQADPSCPFVETEAPDEVISMCIDFLMQLGLRYGAFDFAVEPSGQWWFLECNPNGEWGWIHKTCGLPIPAAIVDELAG